MPMMGGRGLEVEGEEGRRELAEENTSAIGEPEGVDRTAAGITGTGGAKASYKGLAVREFDGKVASVLDRSLTVFWPSILPRKVLAFDLTEDFGGFPGELLSFGLARIQSEPPETSPGCRY
jgi:hypothetical protein